MKTTITTLSVITLLMLSPFCRAQSGNEKFSMNAMPAYVKELQRGAPPQEMMYREPALFRHLMQRRAMLSGMLQQAVHNKQLPQEALNALKEQSPQISGDASGQQQKTATSDFALVKDINTSKSSNPYNFDYSVTSGFATLNKVVYYSANDGVHGTELWRSDGTVAGTYMVKDINSGTLSSSPQYITAYKNKLYFTANSATTGFEVYQSDGTAAGTVLLKDVIAGATGSFPYRYFAAVGNLYFTVSGGNYASQLWKTDGTTANTVLVADIYSDYNSYGIGQFAAANGLLFFTAYSNTYGRELWRSDGTQAGTYLIKDINLNNNNYLDYDGPTNLTSFNNLLYFSASSSGFRTLWQSDGTYAGTNVVSLNNGVTVVSSNIGYAQYEDQPFAIAKNSLFFAGNYYTTGTELYKFNPSNGFGIVLVKDISTADVSSQLVNDEIRSMNDSIYFFTPDFTGVTINLWKSGGTEGSTKIVKAIPGISYYTTLFACGSKLYFTASTASNGAEPWVSDGSASGTKLLKDITAGTGSSNPYYFTLCNGKTYFSAYSGANGTELWITNGTTPGTNLVSDVNTITTDNAITSYNYNNFYATVLNADKIIFQAYQPSTGYELWKSNGTAGGTSLIKELVPGTGSSNPQIYETKNGKAYFLAYDSIGTESIYVTDGSAGNTKKIASSVGYIYDLHVANNGTVFYASYSSGSQLWRTDSNANNFVIAPTIYNINFATAGNLCYFAGNNNYGVELWRSDGTIAGTYLLSDNYPGSGSSYPTYFTPFNGKMLFDASSTAGNGVWITDGTTAGTVQLSTIISGNFYYGSAIANSKLFFSGYSYPSFDYELYVTDGSVTGTKLLKDISTAGSSYPNNFITSGSDVYFTAADDTHGRELWKTSGNAGNTKLVKDITPGLDYTSFNSFTSAGGKLYFTVYTYTSGQGYYTLWSTDGTTPGTTTVSDAGLANITTYGYVLGDNDKLFLSGNTYAYGLELYEGDVSANKFNLISNASAKTINTTGLSAQLLANPIINDVKLNINSPAQQQLFISINNISGEQLVSKTIIAAKGSNAVSLDAKLFAHGTYIININSKTGNVSLKAIK